MSLSFALHVSGKTLSVCVFSAESSLVEYLNLLSSLFPPGPDDVVSAGWFQTTPLLP